ncbi:MAG: hypothetical protein ALECFALPRED_006055 [Alectoria fallacina]|uniref:Aminoglycoside phosphotransferase domain-containing protein n=1 Tax=Alectoria fallacina TaxID=1903189 RepID=A0A8H3G4Y7_9LECA|nr:MAG: hypothetical protein ALECFALPRED_006055 [Alectoria fallacina]
MKRYRVEEDTGHSPTRKKARAEEDTGHSPTRKKARAEEETDTSEAAKFNDRVLRKLQRAFAADPEGDLLANFPTGYSTRLAEAQAAARVDKSNVSAKKVCSTKSMSEADRATVADAARVPVEQTPEVRTTAAGLGLLSLSTAAIVFPLSEPVQGLLGVHAHELSAASPSLWNKLYNLIDASEIIWQNGPNGGVAVLKCSADIVVKMVPNFEDYTEYTTMEYLGRHAPEVPVPKPLGVLISEKTAYIFMSFVPGSTLESVWTQLPSEQKASISNQLSRILLKLRELELPKDSQLGGIGGEGCKDTRRHTRISRKPIRSIAEFEDFIFSSPHFGGSVYIKLLRSMSQSHTSKVVFSHGDLRPANIVVQSDQQCNYSISGILDWEMGGFYPDYWESVKATNTMAPQEEDDWYLYLPGCASPTSYPLHWLVDRKWDVHVA